jgi:cobalt transporter subunit CbtB
MTSTPLPASVTTARTSSRRASLLAMSCAALLGALILYGVGFAQPSVAHNAAHDARHAQGFPCH